MSVQKIEGATKNCHICGHELVCHQKVYPASGGYPEKKVMQWQNLDGSAHYETKDGKNFKCVDKDKNEIKAEDSPLEDIPNIEDEAATIDSTDISQNSTVTNDIELESVEEKVTLESLNEKLNDLKEMIAPIFQWVVDQQLKEGKSSK